MWCSTFDMLGFWYHLMINPHQKQNLHISLNKEAALKKRVIKGNGKPQVASQLRKEMITRNYNHIWTKKQGQKDWRRTR